MRLILLFPLLLTLGCSSSLKKADSSLENLSLVGLSLSDLSNLDEKQFLIEVQAKKNKDGFKKRAALVFLNPEMTNRKLNLNTINLKFWLRGFLNDKGYLLEKLNSKTNLVIVVSYGVSAAHNKNYEETFGKSLTQKKLEIKALDYQALKKDNHKPFWEGKISSVGPENDISLILPAMASFLKDVIDTDLDSNRIIIPSNDPRLQLTKEVPTAIPIDEFKPSIEELNFFN